MLYSKRRKNLGGGRRKRSNRRSYGSKRLRMIGGASSQKDEDTIELDPKLTEILTNDQKETFKLLLASSDPFYIKPYQKALIINYDSDTTADKSSFKKAFKIFMDTWSAYNKSRPGDYKNQGDMH